MRRVRRPQGNEGNPRTGVPGRPRVLVAQHAARRVLQ